MDIRSIAEIEEVGIACEDVRVIVWCSTYNHKNYIKEAFEGFLNQKCDFKFQVFVYDDASTDGASEIIREYATKYPTKIYAFLAKKNTFYLSGCKEMREQLLRECAKGKYVAYCEGDDYWCDSKKLQKQVDFLDRNDDFVMAIHPTKWIDCVNDEEHIFEPYNSGEIKQDEFIRAPKGIPSVGSIIQRVELLTRDEGFPENMNGDEVIFAYAAMKGKIYSFDEAMSVYRYRHEGSWTFEHKDAYVVGPYIGKHIAYFKALDEYSGFRFHKAIRYRIESDMYGLLNQYGKMNVEDYNKELDRIIETTDKDIGKYIEETKRIYLYINELEYVGQDLLDHIKKKHILIYGTGNFGKIMAEKLNLNNIQYEGHIISDNQEIPDSDTRVWRLKDIPFDKKDVGIIVAVNHTLRDEIEENLEIYGLNDYYSPYWFNED